MWYYIIRHIISISPKSNAKICQVFLLYICDGYHTGLLQSVKHFYLTDGYCPTCKNTQKASYTQKTYNNTILLWYVSMWGCIYIFRNGSLCPRVGMCSTHTPTSKLYQIFTQFTKSPQIHFDSHFDKILKIQAKINFLTI